MKMKVIVKATGKTITVSDWGSITHPRYWSINGATGYTEKELEFLPVTPVKKTKTYTCKACGKKSEQIGVSSVCTQTLTLESDDWTNLEVGETLSGFCLECGEPIPAKKLKTLIGE